jgi:hypothetical protein
MALLAAADAPDASDASLRTFYMAGGEASDSREKQTMAPADDSLEERNKIAGNLTRRCEQARKVASIASDPSEFGRRGSSRRLLPMRSPNRFTMAAAAAAQGGV